MRFKFFKNNDAVSQLIGYILTLSITSGLMVGIVLMSNEQINNSNKDAANLMAQDIANVVTEGVLGAVSTRRLMENTAFEFELDVPTTLAGKSYYVDIADKFVYVNSTDGAVSKKGSNFNAGEFGFGISGKAYGSNGKIKVFCEKNEDVCKFDFGTRDSKISSGYIQIHPGKLHNDLNPVTGSWWNSDWKNRLLVTINNQVYGYDEQLNLAAQDLYDFQYRFTLKPAYFDYNKAKEDGSDIRVINSDKNEQLDHWIESWNPLGPSKIWVKLSNMSNPLSKKEIMNISIYYGNDEPIDGYVQDPRKVFNFYDDFDTLNNWSSPFSVSILKDDESYLNITQRNATVLNVESLGPGMSVGPYDGILHFRGPGYVPTGGPSSVSGDNFVMYTLYMVEAMMDLSSNYSVSEEEAGSQSGMTGASGGKATTGASMGVMMNLPSSAIITGGYPQDYIIERGFLDKEIENVSAGESVVSASGFVGLNGFPTSTTSNTVEEVFSSSGGVYTIDFDTNDPPDGNPEGSFTAVGNQKVLSLEITGSPPFVLIDWKWKDVSDLSVYSPLVTQEAKICIMDGGGSFIEAYVIGKTPTTTSKELYQISIMDVTDEGNYIAYPPGGSYGIVSKAINVAKPTIEDLFNISYVTTSSYNNPGYAFYKNWPLATNPNKLCESDESSTYPNWFLQRTGVFIGRTYNLSASQIYQNYTIIGNARFNCTWDKQLSVVDMLDDVWDTDESKTGFSEVAEGRPIIEGNIGFALGLNDGGKEGTGNLLVDWVRIYQSTMYDLNVTFTSQESLDYGWNDSVEGIDGDLNTYLLYDNNYGTNKKTFIVEELPREESLTVTVKMGSNKATMPDHDTTINIYDGSDNYIKSVHAQDTLGNYTTLYIPIEKRYVDGTLKFEFEDNGGGSVPWLVNSIKIEKGFKKIQISEGYA